MDKQRVKQSESRVCRTIFPIDTNHYGTLFGGKAMQWMDEVAFITATRYCRQHLMTVSSDRIDFKKPIEHGMLVELVANVIRVGRTSIQVGVDIYLEEMYAEIRQKAVSATFTFVAIDENKKPTPIIG